MTLEDLYVTLAQQDMIFVKVTTPPPVRPSPGHSIKMTRGRKNGIARRALQRTQTNDDDKDRSNTPVQLPAEYDIRWDREMVDQYLAGWERKGYMKLKPERLKWAPFLLARTLKTATIADKGPTEDFNLFAENDDKAEEPGVADVDVISELHVSSPTVLEKSTSKGPESLPPINGLAALAEAALSVAARSSSSNPDSATPDVLPNGDVNRSHLEALQLAEDAALARELATTPHQSVRNLRSQSGRLTASPATRSNSAAGSKTLKARYQTRSQSPQPDGNILRDVVVKDFAMESPPPAQVSPTKSRPSKRPRSITPDAVELEKSRPLGRPLRRPPARSANGSACEGLQQFASIVRASTGPNGAALLSPESRVKSLRSGNRHTGEGGPNGAECGVDEVTDSTEQRAASSMEGVMESTFVSGVKVEEADAPPEAFISRQSAPSDDTVCQTPDANALRENGNTQSPTASPIVVGRDVDEYAPVVKQVEAVDEGGNVNVYDRDEDDGKVEGEEDEDAEGELDTELEM